MPATDAISAEEWQLLAFFEAAPTRLDADIAWPYNNFTFENTIGGVEINFSVAPAYKDFTLIVKRNGITEINLSALSVHDIRYNDDRGSEWLEILISSEARIELRLKPAFSIIGWLAKQA